jgi:hypothetical protein
MRAIIQRKWACKCVAAAQTCMQIADRSTSITWVCRGSEDAVSCIELGHLRDSYPAEMRAVDRILFHAGFTKMGVVAPGCERTR